MSTLDDILMHYGMPRRSGRYPYGSGDNPYQHTGDFLSRVDELRKQNFKFTDPEDGKTYTGDMAIAKSMGLNSSQFRIQLSLANSERRKLEVDRAKSLRAEGKSLNEIASIMGYKNDSSIRSLLNADSERRMLQSEKTAEALKKVIDEKGMIDVGAGVERELGISKERLRNALDILQSQGYPVYGAGVPQATNPGKQTNIKVVCPPGTPHKDIYKFDEIHRVTEDIVSHDGGETFDPKWVYPASMDSKRIDIRYREDGGAEKDGVIELRRNVPDLDLGESHYAQVRILVDGTHYIKGMALYSDDMPEGKDIVFNTNKSKDVPMLGPKDNSVLKPIKKDPDNPFGALIKDGINDPDDGIDIRGGQSYYYDKDGKKKLSLINKNREEGDWDQWSNSLSSQFLGKQSVALISKQLNLATADKESEFDEIKSLNNPTLKKAMLNTFADDCDSAAVHLKAAALPRQRYQVLLPLKSIKDDEVYAPNYRDGETVALIRYPHGGTFEIPILKVNNKQKEGIDILGKNPKDAIGVNTKVAAKLSGADFDGDTVMVIPCNSSNALADKKTMPAIKGNKPNIIATELKELEGFDPKLEYGGKKEGTFKQMRNTQNEMGRVSNLIMDMTLKGATDKELARAVKHSMVVIDAEKHSLDYKQSEKDNGIAALKKKYQGRIEDGKYREGAATLLTRAKAEQSVPKRRGMPIVKEDGSLEWKTALPKDLYYEVEKTNKKTGEVTKKTVMRTQKSTQMAETPSPHTLSSGTPQEEAYANYALKMKTLANEARKLARSTKDIEYSPSAYKTYEKEAKSLDAKLNLALLNAPRERQAQMIARSVVSAKRKDNPDMTKAEIKKASQQALTAARTKVGAKRTTVDISDREWEAIQSGAISASKLTKIINATDKDALRQRATPRATTQLSEAKQNKAKAMAASGYTNREIADDLGISISTVNKYV